MSANTLKMIQDSEARWVDLRFTDTKGKEQHVTIPASTVDEDFFSEGQMFDGSSIAGWKGINDSDMIIMPDDSSAVLDPFTESTTPSTAETLRQRTANLAVSHSKSRNLKFSLSSK